MGEEKRAFTFHGSSPQTPGMTTSTAPGGLTPLVGDGRHDLAAGLARWQGTDRGRRAVAEAVRAWADAASALADVLAAAPLRALAPDAAADPDAEGAAVRALARTRWLAGLAQAPVRAVYTEGAPGPVDIEPHGDLVAVLDVLEAPSGLDLDVPAAAVFGLLPAVRSDTEDGPFLQSGDELLAAGAVVFGTATCLLLTVRDGTDVFVRDPRSSRWLLAERGVATPAESSEFAVDASNARHWRPGVQTYVKDLVSGSGGPRERDYTMRWTGSYVAEANRIIRRGGVLVDPSDARPGHEQGRLGLLCQANPLALLCEQAGGQATNGVDRVLSIAPTSLDQRVPMVLGSSSKVERVRRYVTDPQTKHEQSPLFSSRGLFRD